MRTMIEWIATYETSGRPLGKTCPWNYEVKWFDVIQCLVFMFVNRVLETCVLNNVVKV
ncbi:hypothetical protein HanIR_Chr01g0035581 [Helianthus annuus]|nr:hypothetical protein HanIR_Chr01g0035581 [Helianthus annuus]